MMMLVESENLTNGEIFAEVQMPGVWTPPNAGTMILDDVGSLLVAGLIVAKVKTALSASYR